MDTNDIEYNMNKVKLDIICPCFIIFFIGCSTAPLKREAEIPAKRDPCQYLKEDVTYPIDVYDPWESFNRRVYKFNAKFDQYIFLPVVNVYEFVTPDFVENCVSNFFNNLAEIKNLTNSFLQLKGKAFVKTTGRIVINSTVGVVGILDPATSWGIHRQAEDFGQTLGYYGVGNGPYLVLPVAGPSTVRDTGGIIFDYAIYRKMINEIIDELDLSDNDEDLLKSSLALLNGIDARHKHRFRYYETGSPFEYELIRLLYLRVRELQISK